MTLELAYDAVLRLEDAQGLQVTCLSGALWITQEGDRNDAILERGASFVVDREGKTLVLALRDSSVALQEAETRSPAVAGLLGEGRRP